jgi:Na+/phosphate symporter
VGHSHGYAQTARRLQKLADGHRDIALRAYLHVRNQHTGLLPVQIEELQEVQSLVHDILLDVETTFVKRKPAALESMEDKDRQLRQLAKQLNENQIQRIGEGVSKTRLSIMFYAIVGNALMISKHCLRLAHSFEDYSPESAPAKELDFDLD